MVFGNPFFIRFSGYGFSLESILRNAGLYLLSLMAMTPFGLVGGCGYKGRRRWEMVTAILAYFVFYLSYEYAGYESGFLKGLVLGPRYFIPLIPLLAVASGETFPRLWGALCKRFDSVHRIKVLKTGLVWFWIVAIVFASASVHWVSDLWSNYQANIVEALMSNIQADRPVLTTPVVTTKYLYGIYGLRKVLSRYQVKPEDVPRVFLAEGGLQMAFLTRSDSDFFRQMEKEESSYLADIERYCSIRLRFDRVVSRIERLRIWDVEDCGGRSPLVGQGLAND